MAEWSNAWAYNCGFEFRWRLILSLASHFSQLGGAHANETKHDHSPVVYDAVLDPRYDLSFKAYAYIYKQYDFKYHYNNKRYR